MTNPQVSDAIEAMAKALADNVADEVGLPRDRVLKGNRDDAKAALAALEASGWAVVPVEATEAMLEIFGIHKGRMAENYRAMIAARPRVEG